MNCDDPQPERCSWERGARAFSPLPAASCRRVRRGFSRAPFGSSRAAAGATAGCRGRRAGSPRSPRATPSAWRRAKGPHPSQPGATPQENPISMGVRAESPIHRWRGRAGNGPGFQPSRISFLDSWGVAPGWNGLRLRRAGHRTCITSALQAQPHRRRGRPTPTQTPCRTQRPAPHRQTTRRRHEGGDGKDER